jgi:hypothetical protein
LVSFLCFACNSNNDDHNSSSKVINKLINSDFAIVYEGRGGEKMRRGNYQKKKRFR